MSHRSRRGLWGGSLGPEGEGANKGTPGLPRWCAPVPDVALSFTDPSGVCGVLFVGVWASTPTPGLLFGKGLRGSEDQERRVTDLPVVHT